MNLNDNFVSDNDGKFEFKIVVSNFSNLFADIKALVKRNWKALTVVVIALLTIIFFKDLRSLFFDPLDNSTISVSTINCGNENECDIELIKRDGKGDLLWKRIIGGSSYDKAGQVLRTKDGSYILVGSTSSFGKGNYDVLVVKLGSTGEVIWQKTYGEFLNDYGTRITAVADDLYQIEGTKQICKTVNVSNDCYEQEWSFRIDDAGFIK